MIPTLYPDDLVLAIKIHGRVHTGDIVLAEVEDYTVIKRILAFDAQTIILPKNWTAFEGEK